MSEEKTGTTGVVLGIISLFAWILPIVGFPVAIVGIAKSSNGRSGGGMAMSIIGLVLAVLNMIAGILVWL